MLGHPLFLVQSGRRLAPVHRLVPQSGLWNGCRLPVIPNQNTLCVATYQGDLAPNFMVLDASVVLMGPEGERTMPLAEFYELDGMKKNVLKQGEFLLKVVLPKDAGKRRAATKLRVRESWDFPKQGLRPPGYQETLQRSWWPAQHWNHPSSSF